MQVYDVVMIGAGHNGLVCAAYLLKAGYSVLLLEKNSIPGGGATTEPDKSLDFMRTLFTSAKEIVEGYFEEEFVRAPIARLAAEMSMPPSQKTSAIGGMTTSMRHNPAVKR
jgi:phytoene dehydrogenase-like protein